MATRSHRPDLAPSLRQGEGGVPPCQGEGGAPPPSQGRGREATAAVAATPPTAAPDLGQPTVVVAPPATESWEMEEAPPSMGIGHRRRCSRSGPARCCCSACHPIRGEGEALPSPGR